MLTFQKLKKTSWQVTASLVIGLLLIGCSSRFSSFESRISDNLNLSEEQEDKLYALGDKVEPLFKDAFDVRKDFKNALYDNIKRGQDINAQEMLNSGNQALELYEKNRMEIALPLADFYNSLETSQKQKISRFMNSRKNKDSRYKKSYKNTNGQDRENQGNRGMNNRISLLYDNISQEIELSEKQLQYLDDTFEKISPLTEEVSQLMAYNRQMWKNFAQNDQDITPEKILENFDQIASIYKENSSDIANSFENFYNSLNQEQREIFKDVIKKSFKKRGKKGKYRSHQYFEYDDNDYNDDDDDYQK